MKFKRNFFLTYILHCSMLLIIGIVPMMIIMFSVFNVEDKPNIFSLLGVIIIVIFVLSLFFSTINVITWPFSKKNIHLNRNSITYNNKTINFDDVDRVYFELGVMSRTSQTPCCLLLYRNNIIEMSISHISFICLIIILIKCKHVPKRLMPKFIPILGIVLYSITLLISCICYFIYH